MLTSLRIAASVLPLLLVAACASSSKEAAPDLAGTAIEEPTPLALPFDPEPVPELSRSGFVAYRLGGRVWVFRSGSEEESAYRADGPPASHVTWPAAGPAGETLKATDEAVLLEWSATRPGFAARCRDGAVWILQAESPELGAFDAGELPPDPARWKGAGPAGSDLLAGDLTLLSSYLHGREGFDVYLEDGVLWVYPAGDEASLAHRLGERPEEAVTCPEAGPGGITLRAPDREVALGYLARREGFHTALLEGRLWVFASDDPEWARFSEEGALPKRVTLPLAGPLGVTVIGSDLEALERYLAAGAAPLSGSGR
jgi:hypothetical protein